MWKYLSNFLQLWPVAKQWPFCYHGNITRLRRAAGTNLLTRRGPRDHVCSQGQPFSHAVWLYEKGPGPPEGDFLGKTAIQSLTDEVCCGFTFTAVPTLLCEVDRFRVNGPEVRWAFSQLGQWNELRTLMPLEIRAIGSHYCLQRERER